MTILSAMQSASIRLIGRRPGQRRLIWTWRLRRLLPWAVALP